MFKKGAIFLMVFLCLSIKAQKNLNYLKKILYYQGELTDSIICGFTQKPYYFSDMIPVKYKQEVQNKDYKQEFFFVPYVIANSGLLAQKNPVLGSGYKIFFKKTEKPVKGIYILVAYDPDLIDFNHNVAQELDPKDIVLKFHDKQKLLQIKEKAAPLRWVAMGKHQPRIVLDGKYTHSTRINKVLSEFIKELSQELKSHNYEVFLNNTLHEPIAKDIRVNAANMLYRADLFLSFSGNNKYYRNNTIILPKNSKTQLASAKYILSKKCAQILKDKLNKIDIVLVNSKGDYTISQTEMPSISINLASSYLSYRYNRAMFFRSLCECLSLYFDKVH